MTNKGLYSYVCHNPEDKNFQKILSETLDALKKTEYFCKEINNLSKERIGELKMKKPKEEQKEIKSVLIEPLDKEEYISVNLVLFREYTSLLRTKAMFKDDDPQEWKEYIEDQINELVKIQNKIHKIIMALAENKTEEKT